MLLLGNITWHVFSNNCHFSFVKCTNEGWLCDTSHSETKRTLWGPKFFHWLVLFEIILASLLDLLSCYFLFVNLCKTFANLWYCQNSECVCHYLIMSGIEEMADDQIFRKLSYCKMSDIYKTRKWKCIPVIYKKRYIFFYLKSTIILSFKTALFSAYREFVYRTNYYICSVEWV